jgi:hypothetical protein
MQRTLGSPIGTRFVMLALSIAAFAIACWPTTVSAQTVLNENCIVSVLNRNTRVRPDGSWVLPNIPANFGLVRARATCIFNGQTVSGESVPFLILANSSVNVPPIVLGPTTPIPTALALTAPTLELGAIGETSQVTVTATYADGTTRNVSAQSTGTQYVISNPAIAQGSPNGLITARASGTVLVQASHEGTSGFLAIRVVLSADSDGDGIEDALELSLGLNPNNAVDGLEDRDSDGLSNRDEVAAGSNLSNPDTDGDGILDGEEVRAGSDGFVTSPLLADTDGDGVRDGLEVATGSNPTNAGSLNLSGAINALVVTPDTFTITINSVQGVAFRQLSVMAQLQDGTTLDVTSTARGTNYVSSNLDVCNFGQPDGRVFGGQNGTCTITITNAGHTAIAEATVTNFTPIALSSLAIPGFANNVDVSGNFAYVAAGNAGLQVVNVANRNAPVVVASLDTPGNANDIRIVGNVAYVADGVSGLQVINVTNPGAPALLGSFDTAGDAWDVVVTGNRAYVADGDAGMVIIDVTNPATPTLLGTVNPPGIQKGVDVDPGRMLAVLASGFSGIHVVNIADPAAPVQIGALAGGDVRDVALQGSFAFLADYSRSFTAVDLTNPAAPILGPSTDLNLGGRLHDVSVQGNFALGADVLFVNAVPIINIDAPANPVVRAQLNFSNLVDADGQGIAADGGYVYLAAVAGSAFTENGTSGFSRLLIGQYIAIEDLGGVAPTVSVVEPVAGVSVIEGSALSIRVAADDDIAVAAVNFLVNGQPAGTDSSEPYETTVIVPPVPGPMVIGARAVDFGSNFGTAATVAVTVIADPLTTVIGRVVDAANNPVNGASVQLLTFSTTSGPDGTFSIADVPTVLGRLAVRASALVGGQTARGASVPTPPVPAGTTNVGTITLRRANVLLIADVDSVGTAALESALEAAGIPVTRRPGPEHTFDGTNPPLADFTAVIHLNGDDCCYGTSMTTAGQVALTNFVNNGGGFIGAQWNGFERVQGRNQSMLDLVLRSWASGGINCSCPQTWSIVPGQEGHPVLTGISNFSFVPEWQDSASAIAFAVNPSVAIMMATPGPAILVRQVGAGRVVDFAIAPNYVNGSVLQHPVIQQLYINAALWASGQ